MLTSDISRRSALVLAGSVVVMGLSGCGGSSAVTEGEGSLAGSFDGPGGTWGDPALPDVTPAEKKLSSMTLEQKIAQLFIVTPEQLTGVEQATVAGEMTRAALEKYPVGGLCYFGQNITGDQQLRDMLSNTRRMCAEVGAGIAPFLTIDEEGGPLVARVANSGFFEVEHFGNMVEVGASGDVTHAARVGSTIGTYLHEIGFNVDFAPDADVLTNPDNPVIGPRSFGSDSNLVADMVAAEVDAMLKTGVLPCIKHFPGHGDTASDSHTGVVYTVRTRAEFEQCEFLPFGSGLAAGCPVVMVGYIETPNFAPDGLPASLSSVMMIDVLRDQLSFTGAIVSDSFSMGAITENYSAADAAVKFFQAGGDILLMPQSLEEAFAGVLAAVQNGTIDEKRIDTSVIRVLEAKTAVNLLS